MMYMLVLVVRTAGQSALPIRPPRFPTAGPILAPTPLRRSDGPNDGNATVRAFSILSMERIRPSRPLQRLYGTCVAFFLAAPPPCGSIGKIFRRTVDSRRLSVMTAGDRSETTWRPSPKVNNKLGPSEAVPEGERSAGGAAAAAAAAVDLEKGGRGASKAGYETEKEGGALVLVGCFVGLQVAYLSWGVLQERMMTKEYESAGPDGTIERSMFPSVTFIVFANRLLAFFTAVALVLCDSSAVPFFGPAGLIQGDGLLGKVRAPLEMFAPASLSNVMSSFFQYKALVYVSFPTQVLFKSNKIIPTMLMGIALNGKSYKLHEYFQALTISAAVAAFMISEKGSEADESAEEPSSPLAGGAVLGIVCLCLYLCCDSFTSQWQSRVFKKWKVSQYQMMLGVNAFSLMYTFAKAAAFG